MKLLTALISLLILFAASGAAQSPAFDASKVADSAAKPAAFAPAGWKVEDTAKGDLNGDGVIDHAIKLVENKPTVEGEPPDSDRYLVIAFGEAGRLRRAAVAEKVLQCMGCGGAFYGMMPAPAGVTIAKGVLVIENEHGSRNVSSSTMRFRYSPDSGKLELIGFDYRDNDRLTGETVVESSNYITGARVTTRGKSRMTTRRTKFSPIRITIEDADHSSLEGDALKRLGLD
jgi:hypothetical protein